MFRRSKWSIRANSRQPAPNVRQKEQNTSGVHPDPSTTAANSPESKDSTLGQKLSQIPRRFQGWYQLKDTGDGISEFLDEWSDRLDNEIVTEDLSAYWDGERWEDFTSNRRRIPPESNVTTIKPDRGFFDYNVTMSLLTAVQTEPDSNFRIIDYLGNFPTHYGNIANEPEFDQCHLQRWRKHFAENLPVAPELRFADVYLNVDETYASPNGLGIERVNHLLFPPLDTDYGHLDYVKGVVGCNAGLSHFENDGDFHYSILTWIPRYQWDNEIYPRYNHMSAAESLAISRIIDTLIKYIPLAFDQLSNDEGVYLQNALRAIHAPTTKTMKTAKSERHRKECLDLIKQAFPNLHDPGLLTSGQGRLTKYGTNAIADVYGIQLPPPRLIKHYSDAEYYSAEIMESLGYSNVYVSREGADEGVDVWSDEALAQVKMEGIKTSREKVQRLTGVCSYYAREAIFFSLSGYTLPAIEWADKADIALFEFALDGSVVAKSSMANSLLASH